jgi:hypothetical protein
MNNRRKLPSREHVFITSLMYHGFRLTQRRHNLKFKRGYIIPATRREDAEGIDVWVKMPKDDRLLPVQVTQRGVRMYRKYRRPDGEKLETFITKSEKHWLYADSGVEGLSSRKEYLETYKDERIEALRALIELHKPKYVICYSLSYQEDWQKLTDAPFTEVNPRRLYLAKDGETTIAITPHSVMQGLSNDDWKMIIEEMFL